VLFHHDSSAVPQTVQTASPVCGTKNFVSVRLYSAPQLHRTIVAMLGICAYGRPIQAGPRDVSIRHRNVRESPNDPAAIPPARNGKDAPQRFPKS